MTYHSDVPLGDLVSGEVSNWHSGISEIRAERWNPDKGVFEMVAGSLRERPTHIAVYGECGLAERIAIEGWHIDEIDCKLAGTLHKEQERL